MLHQQQDQHIVEMDQVCGQIGPMMEALKLLLCEAADINNFEELTNDEAGAAAAIQGAED